EIQKARPILEGFRYDIGYVGSRWGTANRGNVREWEAYLDPLIRRAGKTAIAGPGTPIGPVSVARHVRILKRSALCPIIHAASWKVEKGVMDRFWTVFSLGRFGVADNEGVLEFFGEDEVEIATDPETWVDKSAYYMKHVDKQRPYIERVLGRIKTEYNQRAVWQAIMAQVNP
ncbi:MAG: glycosyltransferase, partial [Pseudomonadales bacterium]|nr:glycosyltransferase [Pseudomonadales bacterium]